MKNHNIEKIKRHLRGTIIHKLYLLFRYELKMFFKYRLFYAVKNKYFNKIYHLIECSIKNVITDMPKAVAIDIVSCCNLRCPLCSVPAFLTKKDENFMSFDRFKAIVNQLDLTDSLSLVYAGEPLLHPRFFEMVEYCIENYYVTTITNGTLLNEINNKKIIFSVLDFLQISFDGFSKESFEKYRIGADFENVKNNIVNLLKMRQQYKSGLPYITITYLINAFNEHETKGCQSFFLNAGADKFLAKAINLNTHRRLDGKTESELKQWLPKQSNISLYKMEDDRFLFKERDGKCTICLTPIVRCDGEVLLCCHDLFNTVKIGNLFINNFKDLWLSEEYKKFRKLAKQRKLPICQLCGK